MPRICSRGTGAAYNFGFLGKPSQEPPGSYTMPMGWTGASYKPAGWNTVDLVLRGAGGLDGGPYGKGTKLEKTGVPVANLMIYTPTTGSDGRQAQGGSAGNGGPGGSTSGPPAYKGKNGGGASAATWSGGSMIAAGGGGSSAYYQQSRTRGGLYETAPTHGPSYNTGGSPRQFNGASGSENGGGGSGGGCYYGGGGGGGGSNVGGQGGPRQHGGSAGGHLGGPFGSTGGSSGNYGSYTVNDVGPNAAHATITWA